MPRTEIEDFPPAPLVAASAAEYFAPLVPAEKHQSIRLRNVKALTVHFTVGNFKVMVQALRNGMPLFDYPDPFLFPCLTPAQAQVVPISFLKTLE